MLTSSHNHTPPKVSPRASSETVARPTNNNPRVPEHTWNALKLSIPMPNFLIDPQDGQFTPYFERSPVSTPDQECDEPHYFDHPYTSYDSSPDSVLSPLRSRATSIALKKLMETQMQMLLDISAAWKKKYPVDALDEAPRSTAHDEDEAAAPCISSSSSSSKACEVPPVPTSATQPVSFLPANPIFMKSN
ncbi:hypothetical protein PtA15_6A481 [Puccinia triticina]|uniref:Uncharacterized protein n=1 Tax=Puccinia triticina TaxID=208348 RepID=A0ABY7CMY4_9BASI|nr:uncharacterized protein PtA15_6A481 [Puccinia triticina]WAQ85852.1 hypothetical protein PtA15_6A481 [Puccinia triticina]